MNNEFRLDSLGETPEDRPRLVAIASGKGGVGKSVIAFNLAEQASRRVRVLLVDGDIMTGNLHILGNLNPTHGWQAVCSGQSAFGQAKVRINERLDLLASCAGEKSPAMPDIKSLAEFLGRIRSESHNYDLVIFDTASGILPHTTLILHAVDEVILVTTPELTSISDCYALFKVLTQGNAGISCRLLVNRADKEDDAAYIHEKLTDISHRFLPGAPGYFGSLANDRALIDSVARQTGVMNFAPESLSNRQIAGLADRLSGVVPVPGIRRKTININALEADTKGIADL